MGTVASKQNFQEFCSILFHSQTKSVTLVASGSSPAVSDIQVFN